MLHYFNVLLSDIELVIVALHFNPLFNVSLFDFALFNVALFTVSLFKVA